MSGYRKRRSSDSLESDGKRMSFERGYDCSSYIKLESNPHVSHKGQLNYVTAAVPSTYYAPVAPVGLQSAVVYNHPQRYYNSQFVQAADNGNVIPSTRNYNSACDHAIAVYDDRRRMNFEHEVYINSLRQSEPRYVNFDNLRRHLCDIDIRCLRNGNFSTALDLTVELESSLKYFVDTRNELVFLRKLQRQQHAPFSYNDISIANRSQLNNRMKFLENESAYRSNRMNHLFHLLQSVVIPSIIDDIRYVHSVSYEKAWTNRARYWFSRFKQIKWEKSARSTNDRAYKLQQSNHQRLHRGRNVKEEIDGRVNIKSEVVAKPKDAQVVKVEIFSKIQSNDTLQQVRDRIPTMSNIVEKTIESSDCNNNLVSDENVDAQPAATTVERNDNVDRPIENDGNDRSDSIVAIEPNVSVVSVTDDSISNANPPEGDP